MICFTKVMSPPPFLCILSVLRMLYCGIVGVLWWLASFVSCTVAISMLLVYQYVYAYFGLIEYVMVLTISDFFLFYFISKFRTGI